MHNMRLFAMVAALMLFGSIFGVAAGAEMSAYLPGQDLHLLGGELVIYQGQELEDRHVLVFEDGFTMTIGGNTLSSDSAVVFIKNISSDYLSVVHVDYEARVYLEGNVSIESGKGSRTTDLSKIVVERGAALVTQFQVSGQVFANSDDYTTAEAKELFNVDLYNRAYSAIVPVKSEPTITSSAEVPEVVDVVKEFAPSIAKTKLAKPEPAKPPVKQPKFKYPVNIASLWEPAPRIEKTSTQEEGLSVATVIGRFYLWQKRDEKGGLLEFMADTAVVYFKGDEFKFGEDNRDDSSLGSGSAQSAYFKGNIVMTEGPRTIRADEMYYDFETRKALAVNAEIRNFDPSRGIPIYVRAAKLRGVSEDMFQAEDITLTSSEFYLPQVSMTASSMVLTDTTSIDARTGKKMEKSSYDAVLTDVSVKSNDTTLFNWPRIRTNFERPDLPIRKMAIGHDSDYGNTIETQWHLARLLGRKEPDGVDSVLALDYFSKRGFAGGVGIDYRRPDYYGGMVGYMIDDHGEDDLGRVDSRRDQEPSQQLRGRFSIRHRQYLPYDWQLTGELSYLSDRNFLEAFYRNEFQTSKAQETLIHLKRLKDNWAFAVLAKGRINHFENELEELPTTEFHLKGASLWDHMLTFYSDTQVSRFRDRIANGVETDESQKFYTFAFTRNEIDLPLLFNTFKVVPYVAGTYAYEGKDGFDRRLDGSEVDPGDKNVFMGEFGLRVSTMLWKSDPFLRSRFWDLNGLRHIIRPHFEAVYYNPSDSTADMRDVYNIGISQRWQSRRGTAKNLRSFDWMRLDVDATFVNDNADSSIGPAGSYGPSAFIWNNPEIPFGVRRNDSFFGMARDSINADYKWRVSDTTAILSDMNYDIRSGVIQQFDIGVSRFIYPDVSVYLGNRYLRPVIVEARDENNALEAFEKGSNSVVAAMTYALNSRYTLSISQEYNFDYGKNVRSEVTVIRRYHRMYYALTFSADESLDRQSIVFSLWPEGVEELAMGRRRYAGISNLTMDD